MTIRTERHFISTLYFAPHPSLRDVDYTIVTKVASRYAKSINREIAEGPTILIPDNYYGPTQLWPLVVEEGVEYDLPR